MQTLKEVRLQLHLFCVAQIPEINNTMFLNVCHDYLKCCLLAGER